MTFSEIASARRDGTLRAALLADLFSLLSSPEIARAEDDSDEPALDESAELAAPGAAIPNQLERTSATTVRYSTSAENTDSRPARGATPGVPLTSRDQTGWPHGHSPSHQSAMPFGGQASPKAKWAISPRAGANV
jgi:hypothetical protein